VAFVSGTFTPIKTNRKEYIPLDIDIRPMNNEGTKKEQNGWTYKGYEGYHPIFAYFGTKGYMLSCQLRSGGQYCRKGTPEFLKGEVRALLAGVNKEEYIVPACQGERQRGDVGSTMGEGEKEGWNIIIKGNMRQEDKETWHDLGKEYGKGRKMRYPSIDEVFEVIERTIDRSGQALIVPEIEVNTFWSTVGEKGETVIGL
jgi:hypothetical protein